MISERLKIIRSSKNMNQSEFAKLLGIGQSTLGMMEVGKRNVSERHIKTICSICNISEIWLRTGEGEMYISDTQTDIFDSIREELNLSNVEEKILRGYFELDEKSRKAVTDFIVNIGRSTAGSEKSTTYVEEQMPVSSLNQESASKEDDKELQERIDILTQEYRAEKKEKMEKSEESIFTRKTMGKRA